MRTVQVRSLGANAPNSLRPILPPRSSFGLRGVPLARRAQLVVLREAVATEVIEVEAKVVTPEPTHSNGNGNGNGNGHAAAITNGNGNGHSNGAAHSNGNGNGNGNGFAPPTVQPSRLAVEAAAGVVAAAVVTNAANKAVAAAAAAAAPAAAAPPTPASSTAAPSSTTFNPMTTASLDQAMDAESAGQVETVAATAGARRLNKSAAGTPYKAPGGRWSNIKGYSTFQRTLEIWTFAIQFGFKYVLLNQKWTYGKAGMTKEAVSARKKELAVWLREGLVRLGPTFIKIGQQFSTRVDVLSPEFIKELEKLQDNVPPFDSATAREIIQFSLGKKVEEVFESFEDTPIAAASLGQVHIAHIKGQKVVVKVQRPGLKDLFDIDLKNIRALAVWLQKVDPKTDGAARDWVAIYDECSRILYQEIDYTLEGKNADLFRENFAGTPWIKVPKVFWEYSSPEVLVLEYAPGVKINDGEAIDRMGLDRKRLARLAVESYLQQILRHGFFHADPHPGNVAVDATDGGRLIYYDFGMMGSIPTTVKGGLLDLFYGVYQRDPDKCLDALTTMGVYVPTGDKTAVRRTAEFFLAAFQERLDQQRKQRQELGDDGYSAQGFKGQRSKDESKTRRKQILTSIGEDLLVAANDQPFRFPATFTFVVRSFTVLDGIGKSLDPRFDISEIAAPYARELLLEGAPQVAKFQKALQKGFQNQNRAVANLFKSPNKIEDVALTLQKLERGDLKLRVRALEAERALTRVQAWQRVIAAALLASTLVNVGTVLSVSALTSQATAAFVGAAVLGVQVIKNYLTVLNLEKKEKQLAGAF